MSDGLPYFSHPMQAALCLRGGPPLMPLGLLVRGRTPR